MNRTRAVIKNVRNIKLLHFFNMVGWPFLIAFFFALRIRGGWGMVILLFIGIWYIIISLMMTYIRNRRLRYLAMEACDFPAYLECMRYICRFYILKKPCLRQKVNQTDAYLLMGNFRDAYIHLMRLSGMYHRFTTDSRIMYDYFWCRFYAEQENVKEFSSCVEKFKKNWLRPPMQGEKDISGRNKMEVLTIMADLSFMELFFARDYFSAKKYLQMLYLGKKIQSRYEFMKYCYYMGRIELAMENPSVAKHWFAQTVSFGIREHLSYRAQTYLEQLDRQGIAYAAVPPENNKLYRV